MNAVELILILLSASVALAIASDRIRLPYPIVLVPRWAGADRPMQGAPRTAPRRSRSLSELFVCFLRGCGATPASPPAAY